jgi:hypothetical protein
MTKPKTNPKDPLNSIWISDPSRGMGLASLIKADLMPDDYDVYGKGSEKKLSKNSKVRMIMMAMIDDFVDADGNIKRIRKGHNDYLRNASAFARKVDNLAMGTDFNTDQHLRKRYYKEVALQIIEAIYIKIMTSPCPDASLLPETNITKTRKK